MFRPVRKKINEISIEDAKKLLKTERRGVIAVNGDDGYPYAVPINFLYIPEENRIIFHGAKAGHKMDSIRRSDKVCFTVYGNETVGEPDWAPYMQSAVVFGRCALVTDEGEKVSCLRKLARKYYPSEEAIDEEIRESAKAAAIFTIDIEHMSGKQVQER